MAQTMVKGPGEKERPCGRYNWTVILFGLATAIGGWAENAVAESRVSADFNGDGFDDLALGVPGEDIRGLIDAGAVNVIYGSATGLTAIGNQLWHQDSTDIEDLAEDGDTFGGSLASGDFDGDGFGDLAVGVPHEDIATSGANEASAGAVNVIYGSATGLTGIENQFWHQDSQHIEDVAEIGDYFGDSLTSGDFDGDGYDDLAIGVPRERLDVINNAGGVNIIYGSRFGLADPGNDQFWYQGRGILDFPETLDWFSSSLTSGDFDGDRYDDLAIGVELEDIGDISNAGVVNVIYGSSINGLTSINDQIWQQGSSIILDDAEAEDRFGTSLTSGDFNGDGFDDLAIGVLAEDIGNVSNAGAVQVIYGSGFGLSNANLGSTFWHQDTSGILDTAEGYDYFGTELASGDFDGDGYDDLTIGVAPEDLGRLQAPGAVNVLYGSSLGIRSSNNQFWYQSLSDPAEHGDFFGRALTSGDFDGNGHDDLAIGVPGEDLGSISNAGAANVIYGSPSRLSGAGNQFWHQQKVAGPAGVDDGFGSQLSQ
jgi:FG-GAP repeat